MNELRALSRGFLYISNNIVVLNKDLNILTACCCVLELLNLKVLRDIKFEIALSFNVIYYIVTFKIHKL